MATQYTAGLSAGQILTAATMNQIGAAWETWTPALTASTTNPTLGTGSTITGRYGRIQKTVFGNVTIVFGTSGVAAGTGFYFVSLPITAQSNTPPVGSGWMLDNSVGLLRQVEVTLDTTSRVALWIDNSTSFAVAATNPWTWAASDQIRFNFMYEAA
jgi:hypothetical protein